MIEIPDKFRAFMNDFFGDEGDAWVTALPALVDAYAQRWSLVKFGPPFDLSYNYVIPVTRADGSEAVLKVSSPHGEHFGEVDALTLYNGQGVNQLLEVDRDAGVLLLERLRPGTMLIEVEDDEAATIIAAELLQKLWRPAPAAHTFVTVAKWFAGFARHRERFGGTGPLDATIFTSAESIVRDLLAENRPPMLLHGDFHHFNILRAEREPWLIIDPKGVVGDPCYELGAFLYNPGELIADHPEKQRLLRRRIDLLSEHLGFDWERVRAWGVAQSALSAVWSCEGEGYGWEYTMNVADVLLHL
ncbi:MAG: phosphotransferase [Caldilineaceae bacterium]|nr:phosphotransferase [Caldilineaceae bacterium]